MELVASASDLAHLHDALFAAAPQEGAAFLGVVPDGNRLYMRSFRSFEPTEVDQTGGGVAVNDDVKVRELAALKRNGLALVDVHTHPGSGTRVRFSQFDEDELPQFARYVGFKLPDRPFGALVVSEKGYAGSGWRDGIREDLVVAAVGEAAAVPDWASSMLGTPLSNDDESTFDRQIRALGTEGQRRVRDLKVGVVGLGGTGSQAVQQLAHLGVRDLTIVDDDRVDRSNLHRLAGGTWWDSLVRRRKSAVARRAVRRIAPRTRLRSFGSLRDRETLDRLRMVDLLIGCVDNDGARLIMTELAAAYLVPYLDIGVSVERDGTDVAMGGRVGFYLPGGPCLACLDDIDFVEVTEDLEAEALRKIRIRRGYARDRGVEPALMPLNTVLVGLALLEVIAFASGVRPVEPFTRFDAIAHRLVKQRGVVNTDCPVCHPAYAQADRQQIHRYAL